MQNIIYALITFIFTVSSELIFCYAQGIQTQIPLQNYFGLFFAFILFSFIKPRGIRVFSMTMIVGFSFFQMMHIQFYNLPVYPNAILLFFVESSEIFYTLFENLQLFLLPLLLIIPSLVLIILLDKKLTQRKSIPYISLLFLTYLIYNPIRTYISGNTWGRQPSTQEFMGMNLYLSISYFSGKILPYKILGGKKHDGFKPDVEFEKVAPFKGNIILIAGESLTPDHMSLYDYKRKTTPFLESMKDDSNFYFTKAISSGVSTDVALAMFFNSTYGLRANEDILKGQRCLFKLAKDSGFKTFFHSSQSEQQLRYITNSICLNNVDSFLTLDQLSPSIDNPNKADDKILLKALDTLEDSSSNNFLVLHQRGSHSPYRLRYTKEVFKPQGTNREKRVDHYDNSVVEFDHFMNSLIKKVNTLSTPTIVIYLSDHGEGLGKDGVWGHAALKEPSFSIPFFVYSHRLTSQLSLNFPKIPTQFNISLWISKLIGHSNNKNLETIYPKNYQILGNDLDGFSGYLNVNFLKDNKIKTQKRDI